MIDLMISMAVLMAVCGALALVLAVALAAAEAWKKKKLRRAATLTQQNKNIHPNYIPLDPQNQDRTEEIEW